MIERLGDSDMTVAERCNLHLLLSTTVDRLPRPWFHFVVGLFHELTVSRLYTN